MVCVDLVELYGAADYGGDEITVQTGDAGIRFLLVSGQPIQEPVAWQGPIVMNTDDELRRAWQDLKDGTFIRP